MPVTTARKGKKWRVVESGGGIALNAAGTPLDGSGHDSEEQAKRQARAVNASLRRQGKIKSNDLKPEVTKRVVVVAEDECAGCLSVLVGGELTDGWCMGCKDALENKQLAVYVDQEEPNPDGHGFEPVRHRPRQIVYTADEYGWPENGRGVGTVGLPLRTRDGEVVPSRLPILDYGHDYANMDEAPWWRELYKTRVSCTCRSMMEVGHSGGCKVEPQKEALDKLSEVERNAVVAREVAKLASADGVLKPKPLKLLLVRHGVAADAEEGQLDQERPLTKHGHEKMAKGFDGLVRLGVSVDRILSSPYVRTQESAQCLSDHVGDGSYRVVPGLADNDFDMAEVCAAIDEAPKDSTLAIVGHGHYLGGFASCLVHGPSAMKARSRAIKFGYGGVANLEFERERMPGKAQLTALFSSKTLRKLSK